MIGVRIDNNGSYRVRWPTHSRQGETLQLGMNYVNYENSLPAHKQVAAPPLALIETALAAAQAEQSAAGSGEVSRATAAETYRQSLDAAKPKLNVALVQLKAKYVGNQAQLEGWGLDTVPSSSGITVRKPRYDKEWASFLAAYVSKETSLAVAEQITNPPLAEMTALNSALQAAAAARQAGRNQREAAVQTRTAATTRLLDLLQAAAIIIVVTQFNGVVTNDLQHWGFQVVARTPVGDSLPLPS